MRTSLNEIHRIEKYLFGSLSAEESSILKARMAYDKVLRFNIFIQQRVYTLTRLYHRKSLKEEAEIIHRRLFEDPAHQSFQESIHNLFNTYQ